MKHTTYITLQDQELYNFIELLKLRQLTFQVEHNTVLLPTECALDVLEEFTTIKE